MATPLWGFGTAVAPSLVMMRKTNNSEPKRVDTFGCSRTGKARDVNGDQFMIAELKRAARVHHASKSSLDDSRRFGAKQAHVLLVADGVSGQSGARSASSLVVDEVMESILNAVPWTQELDVESEADLRQQLKKTVVRCNEQVSAAARKAPEKSNMASTLTMAFVRWPMAFIVHAGDSRAYLIRDEEIEQLTTDHTVAQQMVEDGRLDADKADTSHLANMLWNAIGGDNRVTPELKVKTLEHGDSLLLCSDGLSSDLNPDSIRYLASSNGSAREACEDLVRTVAAIGGQDDITVAMARFEPEAKELASTVMAPVGDGTAGQVEASRPRNRPMVPRVGAGLIPAQASL